MEYDKLDLIDAKAERLLQKFNSDKDIIMFTNALYILIVLFVITDYSWVLCAALPNPQSTWPYIQHHSI